MVKKMFHKVPLFFGLCLLTVSCTDYDSVYCTTEALAGIAIEIRDDITDEPLAENAIVVVTDGAYSETLMVTAYEGSGSSSAYLVAGAYERAGTYDVNVTLEGYTDWSRSDVEVMSGLCHVETVRLTARLVKI